MMVMDFLPLFNQKTTTITEKRRSGTGEIVLLVFGVRFIFIGVLCLCGATGQQTTFSCHSDISIMSLAGETSTSSRGDNQWSDWQSSESMQRFSDWKIVIRSDRFTKKRTEPCTMFIVSF